MMVSPSCRAVHVCVRVCWGWGIGGRVEALEHNESMHHLQNQTEHQDGEGEHQGSGLREGARDRWGAGTEPVQCSQERAQHSRCGLRVHGGGGVSAEAHLDLLDGVLHQHAVRKADLLLKVVLDLLDEHVLALGAAGIVERSTAGSTSRTPVNAQLLNHFTRQSGVLLNNRRLNLKWHTMLSFPTPSPSWRNRARCMQQRHCAAWRLLHAPSRPQTHLLLAGRRLQLHLLQAALDGLDGVAHGHGQRAAGHLQDQGSPRRAASNAGRPGRSRQAGMGCRDSGRTAGCRGEVAHHPGCCCAPCCLARLCSHAPLCRGT